MILLVGGLLSDSFIKPLIHCICHRLTEALLQLLIGSGFKRNTNTNTWRLVPNYPTLMPVKRKKVESTKTSNNKSWGTTQLLAEVDWVTAVLGDSTALSCIDPRQWGHTITVRNVSVSTICKEKKKKKKSLETTQHKYCCPSSLCQR